MAWTQPKTWSNEPLVASDLNTHLRDNLDELKDPPSYNYEPNEMSDYTTSSTSFVDVDATNLSATITTNGGDVFVIFTGTIANGGTGPVTYFNLDVDGSPVASDDGIIAKENSGSANRAHAVSFMYVITGLSAASHTIKLQWKVSGNTSTLFAGAGTSGYDVHGQFVVREIS